MIHWNLSNFFNDVKLLMWTIWLRNSFFEKFQAVSDSHFSGSMLVSAKPKTLSPSCANPKFAAKNSFLWFSVISTVSLFTKILVHFSKTCSGAPLTSCNTSLDPRRWTIRQENLFLELKGTRPGFDVPSPQSNHSDRIFFTEFSRTPSQNFKIPWSDGFPPIHWKQKFFFSNIYFHKNIYFCFQQKPQHYLFSKIIINLHQWEKREKKIHTFLSTTGLLVFSIVSSNPASLHKVAHLCTKLNTWSLSSFLFICNSVGVII